MLFINLQFLNPQSIEAKSFQFIVPVPVKRTLLSAYNDLNIKKLLSTSCDVIGAYLKFKISLTE